MAKFGILIKVFIFGLIVVNLVYGIPVGPLMKKDRISGGGQTSNHDGWNDPNHPPHKSY